MIQAYWRNQMVDKYKISGTSALAWAAVTIFAFTLLVVSSGSRGFDLYDISQGISAITDTPMILAGGYILFAWSGVALIFMVVAVYGSLTTGSNEYLARTGAVFGLIAGTLFLLYGLIGGFGYFDLSYIESVRSADYIRDAYLPLTIITNRMLAAAVSTLGLWFVLTNWLTLQSRIIPSPISYLGLAAGAIALPGFLLPGGMFSLLALLLAIVWATVVGFQMLRQSSFIAAST